ncbi:hypothetical protein KFK09_020146 [Dendrobium nobile]|uniref:Uncharacterized protein n=1 Tax=Dendrobium nobile TaxID=94219 RepID=A0A8T3AS17_DENNO|nr:hypothetical protein KFK09_020146 [Dendrobium nobile]
MNLATGSGKSRAGACARDPGMGCSTESPPCLQLPPASFIISFAQYLPSCCCCLLIREVRPTPFGSSSSSPLVHINGVMDCN